MLATAEQTDIELPDETYGVKQAFFKDEDGNGYELLVNPASDWTWTDGERQPSFAHVLGDPDAFIKIYPLYKHLYVTMDTYKWAYVSKKDNYDDERDLYDRLRLKKYYNLAEMVKYPDGASEEEKEKIKEQFKLELEELINKCKEDKNFCEMANIKQLSPFRTVQGKMVARNYEMAAPIAKEDGISSALLEDKSYANDIEKSLSKQLALSRQDLIEQKKKLPEPVEYFQLISKTNQGPHKDGFRVARIIVMAGPEGDAPYENTMKKIAAYLKEPPKKKTPAKQRRYEKRQQQREEAMHEEEMTND